MSDVEREASLALQPSQSPDAVTRGDQPRLKGRQSGADVEFTPWREEPLPEASISQLGHRKIVKKGDVHLGSPTTIIPEYHIQPDPKPETVEVTPLIENEETVGLRLVCSCGTVHEVRFEYGDDS